MEIESSPMYGSQGHGKAYRSILIHFQTQSDLDEFHRGLETAMRPLSRPLLGILEEKYDKFDAVREAQSREDWSKAGMPHFENIERKRFKKFRFFVRDAKTVDVFEVLLKQRITPISDKTRTIKSYNFPIRPVIPVCHKRFISDKRMRPRYPVYIISKGRYDSRLTSKALESMGVRYSIVVEPQEYEAYSRVIDKNKILTLPFKNLGQGSIPARNWVWEHSIRSGHKRHWILDDNLSNFIMRSDSSKIKCLTGNIFCAAEDYVDRYTNVGLAGFNYQQFVLDGTQQSPVTLNTRIYSCILIDNSLTHRWRGKYNEDTDLSLRILKDGLCTILFNAFLVIKASTMKMQGGNTDEVYQGGLKRLAFAESLQEQHPDVVRVVRRFGRWHHLVNYHSFHDNKLLLRKKRRAHRDYRIVMAIYDKCGKDMVRIRDEVGDIKALLPTVQGFKRLWNMLFP